jgi:hypothetical protein
MVERLGGIQARTPGHGGGKLAQGEKRSNVSEDYKETQNLMRPFTSGVE